VVSRKPAREEGPMPYRRCRSCGLASYSAARYLSPDPCPACGSKLAIARLRRTQGPARIPAPRRSDPLRGWAAWRPSA
jgi:predicted RNA-binding Zn-ribbon protein involved in translation (DUF1610 family)